MMAKIKMTILLLCPALILAACLNLKQPQNRIEYYSLEYDPPAAGRHPALEHVIRVQPFSISPIYNSHRIIYRDQSYKRQAYSYYKWRANPAQFVTYFLSRDLKASGIFKAVLPGDSRVAPVLLPTYLQRCAVEVLPGGCDVLPGVPLIEHQLLAEEALLLVQAVEALLPAPAGVQP